MKFIEIFNDGIEKWPSTIDLSDGKYHQTDDGFVSENLTNTWNSVEAKVGEDNEWNALLVWVIYKVLHSEAKKKYLNNEYEIHLKDIDVSILKKEYREQLNAEGYENMPPRSR